MKKRRKILFLDIDGVLNNEIDETMWSSLDPNKYGFSESCINEVKRILNETNSEIIWITSWRNHSEDFIWEPYQDLKFKSPFPKAKEIFKDYKQSICDHLLRRLKVDDINYHLVNNNISPKKCKWVILDDDSKQRLYELDGYIQVDRKYGVTKEIADKAIWYLNN